MNLPGPLLTPYHKESIGADIAFNTTTIQSRTWTTANLACYYPFYLPSYSVVLKLWWVNGGTATGNVDCGVYTEGGTRIVSTGSTGQSGASAIQEVNITDTTLAPGRYYMALACSSASSTIRSGLPNTNQCRSMGVLEQATAFALPSTATFAQVSASRNMPLAGLAFRTQVA